MTSLIEHFFPLRDPKLPRMVTENRSCVVCGKLFARTDRKVLIARREWTDMLSGAHHFDLTYAHDHHPARKERPMPAGQTEPQDQSPTKNPATPEPTRPSDAFDSDESTKPSNQNPSGAGGRPR